MQTSLAKGLHPEIIMAYHEKAFQTPVIGEIGSKGGVGKTTVAVNLACALVDMGHEVALADADVDAPNAAILLGMNLDLSVDVFITTPCIDGSKCDSCGACVDVCRLNSLFLPKDKAPVLLGACNGCEACLLVCKADAIHRGKKAVGKTYKTNQGNLTLYTGELIPSLEESAIVVEKLKARVFQEAPDFDVIIVDTSPGAHCSVIKALQGSDSVIAVTEPTPLGAHDFELILKLLDIFELKATAFLNRADLPSKSDAVKKISRAYNITMGAKLNTDDLLIKSYVSGTPIVEMFLGTTSAMVFVQLAHELAQEYLV